MPLLVPHPPLAFDATGTPFSTLYGDVFRSRAGAWSEAREVFVDGCELPRQWAQRGAQASAAPFTVLELGFGVGVNFLATLQAWRESGARGGRLHFVSVEAHPLVRDDLARALDALAAPAPDAQALLDQWPDPLPGLHTLAFDDGTIELTLALGEAKALVPKLRLAADAFFLDGFAPARNPAMWSPELVRALARLARPGATLATWSAAAGVREALQAAGFETERVAGHGPKRHRLRARYAPRWRSFEPPASAPPPARRDVLVVGAGLAGAAVAAGFARRGWQVTVLEARDAALRGASAQPLVADHLHLSPDDNPLARLTRAALSARARERALPAAPVPGKLLLDADDAEAGRRRAMLERLGLPLGYASWRDCGEASALAGRALPRGGLWLPRCNAVDPRALASAWLATPGVALRAGARVAALRAEDGRWVACDAGGRELAAASVAVLANAGDAPRLAGCPSLDLNRVRGQSTLVAGERFGPLRAMIGGDAYAAPLPDGRVLVGGHFDDDPSDEPSREIDRGNLERLARTIGGDPASWLAASRSGPVGHRFVAADRMPAIGQFADEAAAARDAEALLRNDRLPLPRAAGLYGAFAFGSRGLLWSTLAASLLPAMADGAPLPLESDLLRAIDPARFVKRRLRRRAFQGAPTR